MWCVLKWKVNWVQQDFVSRKDGDRYERLFHLFLNFLPFTSRWSFFYPLLYYKKVPLIGGIFMYAAYNISVFSALLCFVVHTFHLLINEMIKKGGKTLWESRTWIERSYQSRGWFKMNPSNSPCYKAISLGL